MSKSDSIRDKISVIFTQNPHHLNFFDNSFKINKINNGKIEPKRSIKCIVTNKYIYDLNQ